MTFCDLRARVEALGYETVPAKEPVDGTFEIRGVSREAVDAFQHAGLKFLQRWRRRVAAVPESENWRPYQPVAARSLSPTPRGRSLRGRKPRRASASIRHP